MDEFKRYTRLKIDSGKHIEVKKHHVPRFSSPHWHSFFEIEIITGGAGKYIINDIEHKISRGKVFFIISTDFHYLDCEEAKLTNVSFDDEVVSDKILPFLLSSNAKKEYTLDEDELDLLIKAVELLDNECRINGNCQRELLYYIFIFIFRKSFTNQENLEMINYEQHRGIKNAISFIETNFRENITLEIIAEQAGYNPTYFSELFKKITGESYIERLTTLRIGYARTVLANGFSVSDACFMSGFGSLSGFLSAFKKRCGMTPSQYRIKHTANK